MAKDYPSLSEEMQDWIMQQHVFFVATAPLSADGHVNLSPKGHDCLRVLDANTVAYLDMTGSGNETSAHIMENARLTLMWCGFEGPPRILRTYGQGEVVLPGTDRWNELIPHFEMLPGARQIIVNHITLVKTSCGYIVPFMDYREERETGRKWALQKGEEGLDAYRCEKNLESIDGLPTPLSKAIEK
ncbi:MAG: pyridoxamine 5'-phosphate oxidase family protein [Anaerolineae bacterium]|nr:pyridoxamine 5'-phosphate oxidase family protein [Anaerolineae bacterium]